MTRMAGLDLVASPFLPPSSLSPLFPLPLAAVVADELAVEVEVPSEPAVEVEKGIAVVEVDLPPELPPESISLQ
jgi:hypothetical protein